ncbi:hypothetical protein AAY473_007795 [Plecturocebus cupreus]
MVLLCCPGSSTMTQSWLTAAPASWARLKQSSHFHLPKCGDYRREPLHPAFQIMKKTRKKVFRKQNFGALRNLCLLNAHIQIINVRSGLYLRQVARQSEETLLLGWSAMARFRLTATSASQVQAILPQPPEDGSFTMLARMVLISRPCDPPTSASQSARITGLSHVPTRQQLYLRTE